MYITGETRKDMYVFCAFFRVSALGLARRGRVIHRILSTMPGGGFHLGKRCIHACTYIPYIRAYQGGKMGEEEGMQGQGHIQPNAILPTTGVYVCMYGFMHA